jgi:hypothetical protein
MSKAKNEMIEKLENTILNELDELNKSNENIQEKLEKGDVLFDVYKILRDYDKLQPKLKEIYAEEARKAKFREERE